MAPGGAATSSCYLSGRWPLFRRALAVGPELPFPITYTCPGPASAATPRQDVLIGRVEPIEWRLRIVVSEQAIADHYSQGELGRKIHLDPDQLGRSMSFT